MLVTTRLLSPIYVLGRIIDLYFSLLIAVIIILGARISRSSLSILLKPDIASLIASLAYSLILGGYIPIMISLFTVLFVLSSRYVEDIIGHAIMIAPRQGSLGLIGGNPGSSIKLYPGIVVEDDVIITRGSLVVREPLSSDARSYREAGDLIAGLSSVESGSAEAQIMGKGSMILGGYREAMRISSRFSSIFSILAYAAIPLAIFSTYDPRALYVMMIAPSIPYAISLYILRRASDIVRAGIISWIPIRLSTWLCASREIYIDAETAIYTQTPGETIVKPRSSLRQEDLLKIICSADNIEPLRSLCKGAQGMGRDYVVIRRGVDMAIIEDRRTRIRICVSTPERARAYGFQGDPKTIEPSLRCGGRLYVVSTKHEILGFVCINRGISISNILTLSRLAKDKRITIALDMDSLKILEGSGEDTRKILEIIDLKIQGSHHRDRCPEKRILYISRNIDGALCMNSIYTLDPRIAAQTYRDIKAKLAAGVSITLRRDLSWIEKTPDLCRKWRKDLGIILSSYAILRIAGSIASITAGILWTPYVLEIASFIITMFRIYST